MRARTLTGRIAVTTLLGGALAVGVGAPPAAATASTRPEAVTAAVQYASSRGYHLGVAVLDTWTGRYYGAGDQTGTFASESVVKVFIATRLLLTGQMHGSTASTAWRMITQSDDGAANALYGRAGGDSVITWIKDHYDLPDLGSPPHLSGWWGNTHITARGLVKFYAKVKADPAVRPWLLNAMHHAQHYGSDGTYQFFGLPSAAPGAAVKQGWGCDWDDYCHSYASFNSTGFVNGDRFAVALLARGPLSTYGGQISALLTGAAKAMLPGGHFPNQVPEITGMSAHSGPTGGGATVTLFGAGFSHASRVVFGTEVAPDFHVVDDRHIQVHVPAHGVWSVYVHVTTPVGTSGYPDKARYAYVGVPVVTGLSTHAGTPRGGAVITVYGHGFTGAKGASVGLVPSPSWHVDSDTHLELRTPAVPAGTVYVRVRTAGGSSAAVLKAHFDYLAPPVITAVSPAQGPSVGGRDVTIVGSGFTNAKTVLFADVPAESFEIVDDAHIHAVTPPHDPFRVYVHVRNSWDDSGWGQAAQYTFNAPSAR